MVHIISRISWYSRLSRLISPDEYGDGIYSTQRHQLRSKVTNLYKSILLYVAMTVCSWQAPLRDTMADIPEPDGWHADIGNVIAAEADLETFDSQEVAAQLHLLVTPGGLKRSSTHDPDAGAPLDASDTNTNSTQPNDDVAFDNSEARASSIHGETNVSEEHKKVLQNLEAIDPKDTVGCY